MKYMKQLLIIFLVTGIGEVLKFFVPLPIPASIYGMVLMFIGLTSGIIKLESVKETAEFLVGTMTIMFIPPAVGLIDKWEQMSSMLVPFIVAITVSTFIVMIVTGKVTDFLIIRKNGGIEDVE